MQCVLFWPQTRLSRERVTAPAEVVTYGQSIYLFIGGALCKYTILVFGIGLILQLIIN